MLSPALNSGEKQDMKHMPAPHATAPTPHHAHRSMIEEQIRATIYFSLTSKPVT